MREEEMTKGMRRVMEVLACIWLILCIGVTAWAISPQPKKDMEADYLNAAIGAVFGAILSVGTAYYFIFKEIRKNRREAKEALLEGLRFNDDRAVQMLGQFAIGMTPNYQFDTTGLIVWLSKSAGLFRDDLLKRINWHRYQMDHANTMLATYYVCVRVLGDRIDKRDVLAESFREIHGSLTEIHSGTHRLLKEIELEATIPDVS